MKVLMLNTFDALGGAARAAARLQKGTRELGIDSRLLVHFRTGNAPEVICTGNPVRKLGRRLKVFLGTLPVRMYPNKPENNFSPALLPDRVSSEISAIDPDIIHLHWVGAGFLSVETIGALGRLGKPIVWTLHDSWAFTGGCHVPFDCARYRQRCGTCPVLGSSRERDLSLWNWRRKERAWRDLDLTVVTPSHWLANCVRSSSLFQDARVEVIPNGIDTEAFQPKDKVSSRKELGLPQGRRIILFGAVHGNSDPNKGFHLLKPVMQALGRGSSDSMAVIFGSSEHDGMPDLGMPVVSLGRIQDDKRLVATYSASDVFVAPSVLENLPNTILESMACGTPCVAFRQGGVPDLIEHTISGYLVQPYDIKDLTRGIVWALQNPERYAGLSKCARHRITTMFSIGKVSADYIDLYRKISVKKDNV